MRGVEREVLKRVRSSAAEDRKVHRAVEALVPKVMEAAAALGAHIEPKLVGSVAKGTHLRNPDIDLFMLFPESTPVPQLRDVGLEIGRRVLGGEEHYAQHPYIRGTFNGFQVDLVPCFHVRDLRKKISAVDRTPFHTEFVKAHLKRGQHDQVRLLKRFMKGIGYYGAEAKVQGFSGYLCELLIIRFGTFEEVLREASGWTNGMAFELPGHPGKEFPEPLTFVDPVDSERNVASAVSTDAIRMFILASRAYLAGPDEKFFFPAKPKKWQKARISKAAGDRLENMTAVSFERLDLIDDVLYPQLRKSLASMTALLERSDFEVVGTAMSVEDEVTLLIELSSMRLPRERVHRGPFVGSPNELEFRAKWDHAGLSEPYKEGGRWYVVMERKHVRADTLLKDRMSSLTLGKDVKNIGSFIVESGDQLLARRYAGVLTHYLDESPPWER
ncbi:MAG TPA: CCA tRNA nucleotidyltransferase [Thermoplasmata archaeon]|nr:CCA tRNA nucleotidyltransferase [Thermoplasmata archaeon]